MENQPKRARHSGKYTGPRITKSATKSTYSESTKIERAVKKALEKTTPVGHVDVDNFSATFSTTGDIEHVNLIPQGDGVNKRTNDDVELLGLQIRGRVHNLDDATSNDCAMLLVLDKKPIGATPPITAILKSATSTALNNQDNKTRFRILRRWDWTLVGNRALSGPAGTVGPPVIYPTYGNMTAKTAISIDEYVSLKGIKSKYNGATGADTSMTAGVLYLITVGSSAGTAASAGTFSTRCRFLEQ